MDEENDEWKRMMEEKLLQLGEKPSGELDCKSERGAPKAEPVTDSPVHVVHVSKDEAPKVASIVRSMETKMQSSVRSGPGRGPSESLMSIRHLGKVSRGIDEYLSSSRPMPLSQLLSKRKRGKRRPALRLHSITRDSDEEESDSETEDIISTENQHDDQNMQLKCAFGKILTNLKVT